MEEKITLKGLLDIYDNEISKTTKNKNKMIRFEKNKIQILNNAIKDIKNNNYYINHYNIFMISEPKIRVIMSLPIRDKIVNHFVTRNILEVYLSKYLIDRNIATRVGMGTDYGVRLIKKYLELNKKYDKFYILKMDISKYFYSIDHIVLKNMLKNKIDDFSYNLISNIIDSTNLKEVNKNIIKLKNTFSKKYPNRISEIESIPLYKKSKGLPIGNMTSQFLSIFYLHELDYYIVHNLHIKHYIRYMDDFILIHPNKKYLIEVRDYIKNRLKNYYKLDINEKKTKIVSNEDGFSFLGYTYKVVKKKIIIHICSNTLKKAKKTIKKRKYEYDKGIITYEQLFCSINTFKYSYKYGNNQKIIRYIDKLWC